MLAKFSQILFETSKKFEQIKIKFENFISHILSNYLQSLFKSFHYLYKKLISF